MAETSAAILEKVQKNAIFEPFFQAYGNIWEGRVVWGGYVSLQVVLSDWGKFPNFGVILPIFPENVENRNNDISQ